MPVSRNRSVVIISGLLTLLVLSGGTLALAFHNGWLRAGSSAATSAAVSADSHTTGASNDSAASTGDSTPAPNQDEASVYRQKLEEAYRALDDAYAQIRVLQAPQVRLASDDSNERGTGHERDEGRRERRSRGHDSDDH